MLPICKATPKISVRYTRRASLLDYNSLLVVEGRHLVDTATWLCKFEKGLPSQALLRRRSPAVQWSSGYRSRLHGWAMRDVSVWNLTNPASTPDEMNNSEDPTSS